MIVELPLLYTPQNYISQLQSPMCKVSTTRGLQETQISLIIIQKNKKNIYLTYNLFLYIAVDG